MKLVRLMAAPVLALALTGVAMAQGYGQDGPPRPPEGYGQGYGHEGWDAPPPEFREVQRQGFHDGIEGARRDVENHRRPNVNNRDEFRHPNVAPPFRHDYREGFRRGYTMAMEHMANGGGPRPY